MESWLNFYSWITSGEGPQIDPELLDDDDRVDMEIEKWKRELNKDTRHSGKHTKHFEIE